MATGSWSLRLRDDTPRSIRDAILPFSMVAVFPSTPPIRQTDANVLAAARYVGIVHRPGESQLEIGGPGLAAWLGQDGISYDVTGTAVLPETVAASTAGSTLNTWLDSYVIPGTPFTRGTTGPSGSMVGSFQFITARDLLETLAAFYGAEWRIRPTLALDVASYSTLYGSTPEAVITRNTSARDFSFTSVAAQVQTATDVADFVSRVVVLGSAGRGTSGASSTWIGPSNVAVKATRVIDAPDVPAGAESSTAASFVALVNSERRELRLSTAHYDVSGDIGVGSLVYFYDAEAGIVDSATPVRFRGEIIRPVVVRTMALTWPVRQGMGVALRTYDGSVAWTDLTPYVVPEDGDAEIEIGAARPFVQGDQLSLRADLRPRLSWSPWQAYTATVAQTGGTLTIGNATVDTRYRRNGTTIEVIGRIAIGTTTAFATGLLAVILPTGLGVSTFSGTQLGSATFTDASAGQIYGGQCYISSASPGTIFFRSGTSPMADVTQAAPFAWAATDELQFSISIELAP